jgi:putative transposase
MPKRTTPFRRNQLYHAYNRAFKMEPIFRCKFGKARFLEKSWEYARRFGVSVESYAVLDDHFHFLLRGGEEIGKFMMVLQTSYGKYYNLRNNRKGPVFWGRYGIKEVKNKAQYKRTISYILENPPKYKFQPRGNPGVEILNLDKM